VKKTEYPVAIRELIAQLRGMPGVGPRSAERIALWMVQARGEQPDMIARAIATTRGTVRPCTECGFHHTLQTQRFAEGYSRAGKAAVALASLHIGSG
jgi:recombination protein RecR